MSKFRWMILGSLAGLLLLGSLMVAPAFAGGMEVLVDIKPTSCDNPLNINSKGTLPVAILGTPEFDVTTIDVTILNGAIFGLEGVSPLRTDLQDRIGPVCDEDFDGDGLTDLVLKFNNQAIVEALGDPPKGTGLVPLTLNVQLLDGTVLHGHDMVFIK